MKEIELPSDVLELVGERSDIEVRLRESEKRYHDLLEHLPVGVYRTTPDGRFIEANRTLADLLGFENHEDLFFYNVEDFYLDRKDRNEHLKKLSRSSVYFKELRLKRRDDKIITVRDFPRAIRGEDGEVAFYAGILVDVTQQKEAEERLKAALRDLENSNRERQAVIRRLEVMSLIDDLTDLYNRRGFFAAAAEHLHHAAETKKRVFLVFLDLDNLKTINDTWGHSEGDKALTRFAGILKQSLRKSDIKGRLGGDEFAVLAREAPEAGVQVLIDRIRKRLDGFNARKRHPFRISVSIGTAVYDPESPRTIEELLVRADQEMYSQKQRRAKT